MDVLSVSPMPAQPGTAARGDAAQDAEPGAFAEVLGQRLQQSDGGPEASAHSRPARHGGRKPQEAGEREPQALDALPLIAAAIEHRDLARAQAAPAAAGSDAERATLVAQVAPRELPEAPLESDATEQVAAVADDLQDDAMPLLSAAAGRLDRATTRRERDATVPAGERQRPAPTPSPLAAPAQVRADAAAPVTTDKPALRQVDAPATARAAARIESAAPGPQPQDPVPRHEAASGEVQVTGVQAAMAPATAANPVAATAAAAAAPAQGRVAPPVASANWGTALGSEVARLHHAGHSQAQLELNPPGLGPLSVSLSVADQQAQALFVSPHPAVRAAVEAALPQLRSALADQGISLGQASVGAEHQPASGGFAQPQQDQAPHRRHGAGAFAAQETTPVAPALPARRGGGGGHVLDTFA